jgi:hypothetical protein
MELPYDCPKCFEHYLEEPFMVEALSSVAMSRGISTAEMAQRYYRQLHLHGHRDAYERMTGPEVVEQVRDKNNDQH